MKEINYESEIFNKRSTWDKRKKVDYYVISFQKDGYEFRKSFEFPVGTKFEVVKKHIESEMEKI